MLFLVDAQLPPGLARVIEAKGHKAFAVREIGLREADDIAIVRWAQANAAVIVTKDEDFPAMAAFMPDMPQVLWVRCGNLVRRVFFAQFDAVWPELERHLLAGEGIVEMRSAAG